MSDEEEEVVYQRRTKAIHYGSLQEQEEKRLAQGGSIGSSMSSTAISAGIAAGNININKSEDNYIRQKKLFNLQKTKKNGEWVGVV